MQGFTSVASTNTQAQAWAAAGAPEGSTVVAEYQTAGRGRLGRSWQAQAGQNLTLSIILRPGFSAERLGLIILAASVAVAEAVESCTAPLIPSIKWPNDVLIGGRKCCGMLLETVLTGPARPTVILGIGLNVNQGQFPPPLEEHATSLLLETGRFTPRAPLLAALLSRLEHHYQSLALDDGKTVRERYRGRLARLNQRTRLHLTGTSEAIEGTIEGISETGAIILHTEAGPRVFHTGDVTTQPS
jgi:BirA family biotin operon repressor/biotin-[acetyl-CoA-carboxylase] ligase